MGSHQGSYFQMTIQPLFRENLNQPYKTLKKIVGFFLCDALTSNHHLYGVMFGSHFQMTNQQ